jgi:anti-sigma28 factor (negative regulator of flagellin synthesis)
MGSVFAGAAAGALQGGLYGGLTTGGIGALPGAALGAIVGGATGYMTGNSTVAENGTAVSNIEHGPSEAAAQKTTSEELKPIISELSAAIRSIPSSITMTGDLKMDSSKLASFILDTVDTNRQRSRGMSKIT